MPKSVALAAAFGLGTVLLLGLWLLAVGARNVWYAFSSAGWPRTQGTVSGASQSTNVSRDRNTGDVSVTYSAATAVVYRVDGVERATGQIRFGQTFGSGDASEAELQTVRYPPGTEVAVSYHPARPWLACVKPGLHADSFWLPGAGLAFVLPVVMCLFVFSGVREFSRRPRGDTGMAVAAAILAGIFCILGVLGLASGIGRLWHGYTSRNWPVAEGEVTYSDVTRSASRDRETGRVASTFSPRFVYGYDVAGIRHFNNLRRFGRIEGSDAEWADEIAANYPRGRKVKVRYLPSDPDVSVLEPGNSSEALWLPGIALVALLFGIAAFVFIVPGVAKG